MSPETGEHQSPELELEREQGRAEVPLSRGQPLTSRCCRPGGHPGIFSLGRWRSWVLLDGRVRSRLPAGNWLAPSTPAPQHSSRRKQLSPAWPTGLTVDSQGGDGQLETWLNQTSRLPRLAGGSQSCSSRQRTDVQGLGRRPPGTTNKAASWVSSPKPARKRNWSTFQLSKEAKPTQRLSNAAQSGRHQCPPQRGQMALGRSQPRPKWPTSVLPATHTPVQATTSQP